MNTKGLSLSELNKKIKEAIQFAFPQSLWIIGEISELKVNNSGHCYLELVEKDSKSDNIVAKQKAIAWSYTFRMLLPYFESVTGYNLIPGLKILVNVQLEFHEIYGLSLIIKDIDPSYTIGDLAKKKREIILRLRNEGVIDMNRIIPFPMVPQNIAVISSETAAGYGDFMNSLYNNTYGFKFNTELFTAIMQGDKAEGSIIEALDRIFEDEKSFDVVVIIRGGGATSDLECFNNYNLVYHITQFPIPVITGIGHERDETIADIVAHTSLKTPTAVAEFLIDRTEEFYDLVISFEDRVYKRVKDLIEIEKQKISKISNDLNFTAMKTIHYNKALMYSSFQRLIMLSRQYRSRKQDRLSQVIYLAGLHCNQGIKQSHLKQKRFETDLRRYCSFFLAGEFENLSRSEKNIDYLDPSNVLKRGYSITSFHGKIVKDALFLKQGDILVTRYSMGTSRSEVLESKE